MSNSKSLRALGKINVEGIVSNFIDQSIELGIDINNTYIDDRFSISTIQSFNKRYINPNNINAIIELCNYLQIEDTEKFIIGHCVPNNNYSIDSMYLYDLIFPDFLTHFKRCDLVDDITCYGSVKWLRYAFTLSYPWTLKTSYIAASKGHLECLKCLNENGCPLNMYGIFVSAKNGHLDCIKYQYEMGSCWDKFCCQIAAENGHLNCLKYLHESRCPWETGACQKAAKNGHLECLEYLYENSCPMDKDILNYAIENKNLLCVKYLHENGCYWDIDTTYYASHYGNLVGLIYLHENGCPWDEDTTAGAAESGHLDCLK